MGTRWQKSGAPRGDAYDALWRRLAAEGRNVHGEADLVEALIRRSGDTPEGWGHARAGESGGGTTHAKRRGTTGDGYRVLDAGCGTGRVAIELARRGFSVAGVDADARMLAAARAKSSEPTWIEADLADPGDSLGAEFDLIVAAGNVMIFLTPGTEARVLRELGARLAVGGLLVSGFQIRPDRVSLEEYDRWAASAGLEFVARWATWCREPYTEGDYAVSVHRRKSI